MVELTLQEVKAMIGFMRNYRDLGGWEGNYETLDSAMNKIISFIHHNGHTIMIEHGLKKKPFSVSIVPSSNPYKQIIPIEITDTTFTFEVPDIYLEDEFHWAIIS